MDATSTLEIQTTNPDNTFYIEKMYTFGEITICLLLCAFMALEIFIYLRRYKN